MAKTTYSLLPDDSSDTGGCGGSGVTESGIGWVDCPGCGDCPGREDCPECGASIPMDGMSGVSTHHDSTCSLHPDNVDETESELETIDLTPNWEGMRAWILHMFETDPTTARKINAEMGCEAATLPDA